MDLPESLRNILGNGSGSGVDPDERSQVMDGGQRIIEGGEQISIQIPEGSDVDREQIEAALSGNAGSVSVEGQAGGETTVTPVASGTDIHITDSAFDLSNWEYNAHLDDRIQNLMDNRVDYNQETGKWILANDDLIPGIMIRLKSIILGEEGLGVDPEDPDSEADQRLADHMEAIYSGDAETTSHVDPQRVVDRIIEQNVMNAVWVGRSTDLQHLDVDDLSYVKDGETGRELYVQEPTTYTTFDISEDGEPSVGYEWTDSSQALEIGEQVLDVRLYRTPPLQAVADDVLNKLQIKRFTGRKAEIASIGGVIIKVNPPAWLPEEDYGNYIDADQNEFGDSEGRLLELVMAQQIDSALETLESYQTATVMSIPENWEIETVELPEMDESMQDMIRGYNQAISRRLLLPLDLLELDKGSELSRDTMMGMFVNMIRGWQGQITAMFDQFARIQADIHGMAGSVKHTLPTIEGEDESEIVQLLNFAGLLGLSDSEARELANTLEGVDLETDTDADLDLPEPGGPEDPEQREQQMRNIEDQQDQNQQNPPNQGPESPDGDANPGGDVADTPVQAQGAEEMRSWDLDTLQNWWDGVAPDGSKATCIETMTEEVGDEDRAARMCQIAYDELGLEGAAAEELPEGFPTTCRSCGNQPRIVGEFTCPACTDGVDPEEYDGELAAALSDEGAIRYDEPGEPICWVCGDEASHVKEVPPYEYTCQAHTYPTPNQVPIEEADISASVVPDGWEVIDHVEAAHQIQAPTMREAAVQVREIAERQTPDGFSTEMRKLDDDTFAVFVRDRQGNFQGSMRIREDPTTDGQWIITGADEFVFRGSEADDLDLDQEPEEPEE